MAQAEHVRRRGSAALAVVMLIAVIAGAGSSWYSQRGVDRAALAGKVDHMGGGDLLRLVMSSHLPSDSEAARSATARSETWIRRWESNQPQALARLAAAAYRGDRPGVAAAMETLQGTKTGAVIDGTGDLYVVPGGCTIVLCGPTPESVVYALTPTDAASSGALARDALANEIVQIATN